MEFDTGLKFKPSGSVRTSPGKDYETYLEVVSAVLRSECPNVGDSGAGEFWMDYSSPLQTRHLVVNVEKSEEEGCYDVKFRAGKRPGRLADVLVMGFALLLMWCLSKSFVPQPEWWYVAGAVVSVLSLAGLLAYCYGKTFGKEETAHLMEKLEK